MTAYISCIQQYKQELMAKNRNENLNFQFIFPSIQMHMWKSEAQQMFKETAKFCQGRHLCQSSRYEMEF